MIGYARVSTDDQDLALQLRDLRRAGCADGHIHTDKRSAVARHRPGLEAALKDAVAGDTFVVWKLDRLGRSVLDLLTKIQALEKRGVKFKSLTEGIDTTTIVGTLLLHILGAIAQFERSLIAERTTAGIRAGKAAGRKFGPDRKFNLEEAADLFRQGLTVDQVCERFPGSRGRKHIGRSTVYTYFDAETVRALQQEGEAKSRRSKR